MKPGEVFRAAVVQIDPSKDPNYGGAYMVVTDFTHKTVTGYVIIPRGKDLPPGQTFLERDMDAVALSGRAEWLNGSFLIQCPGCGEIIQPTESRKCDLCNK